MRTSYALSCVGDEVELTPEAGPEGTTRYHVKGCGQRAIFLVKDGVATREAPAASESKHVRKITMKASFKLACHPGKIAVASAEKDLTFGGAVLPSRAVAKGCGHELIFVLRSGAFEEAQAED